MEKTAQTQRSIAMPRALWYHLHPGLWEAFFSNLGFSVLLSGETASNTVGRAALISESEHCLPLKLHDAHLQEAAGMAGMVFIPRILSTLPGHIACPKLGALPDCARAQFGELSEIVSVDVNEAKTPLRRSLLRLGRRLGAGGGKLRSAADQALARMQQRRAGIKAAGGEGSGKKYFLILGHPYNLYDRHMSGPVTSKIEKLQAKWRLIDYGQEHVEPELIKWDACSIMYHTLSRLQHEECAGVIQLSSFNCGCDSVAMQVFRDLLKERAIPYMTLVLDEHEAMAGIDTRLEAFVDSVNRCGTGLRGGPVQCRPPGAGSTINIKRSRRL